MEKIAVITDTDSSLPAALAERYGILQVPIKVHFGQDTFTTGADIDDQRLFEKINQYQALPTTTAPTPDAFCAAFEQALHGGATEILCICVSSKVSSTYTAALAALEHFPQHSIVVIDSLSLSMGQGFMAIAAAEAARAGAGLHEAAAAAEDVGRRARLYAALGSLKYLAMGRRIGGLAAGLADALNVKPLLTVVDGKLALLERTRTRKLAFERILELTCQSVDCRPLDYAAVIHTNDLPGAQALQAALRERLECPPEIHLAEFTPGLSVHAGEGVVGVVVVSGAE